MKHCFKRASVFALLFLIFGASDVLASHFRYGTIRWRPEVVMVSPTRSENRQFAPTADILVLEA